tara:strand:- start:1226 stop:1429 length:204 start_codon:yes stop_codon:yes gene_type:complete
LRRDSTTRIEAVVVDVRGAATAVSIDVVDGRDVDGVRIVVDGGWERARASARDTAARHRAGRCGVDA